MENSGLHDDLLVQILTRLPLKSLLRFRCVSKSWRSLVSSQYFSQMHLEQSLIDPKPLRLILTDGIQENNHRMGIFAADFSNFENSTESIQQLHHPFEEYSWQDSILLGSCNGLLCLVCPQHKGYSIASGNERYVVFNPLTRRCTFFPGQVGAYPCGRSCFYGFGYDDAHDDYKVVTWGVCPFGDMTGCSKFDVYSIREKSWSARTSASTEHYISGISCGVLVNCRLHWIWRNNEGKYCIIAFDLRNEEHMLMETPDNDLAIPEFDDGEEEYFCKLELGVLNGSLCGIVLDSEAIFKIDLWLMKEYGIKDSWIKMRIVLPLNDHPFSWVIGHRNGRMTQIVPILHLENKKQIIFYSYVEGILLCDMVTNQLSKVIKIPQFDPIKHHGVPRDFSFVLKEFHYQGSLVDPPGSDRFDLPLDKQLEMNKDKKRRTD